MRAGCKVSALNSLLGGLFMSSLLSASFGILSYSCVWNIFFYLLILPNSLPLYQVGQLHFLILDK